MAAWEAAMAAWRLDGLVKESGDVLFAVSVRGAQHHHAVPDAQRVQVVQHHVVRLGQQARVVLYIVLIVYVYANTYGKKSDQIDRFQVSTCPSYTGSTWTRHRST